jgi:hypothetical protein
VHILKEEMMPLTGNEPYKFGRRDGIIGAHIEGTGVVEEQILPADLIILTEGVDLSVHSICG